MGDSDSISLSFSRFEKGRAIRAIEKLKVEKGIG